MNYGGCRKGAALKRALLYFHQLRRSDHESGGGSETHALQSRAARRTALGFRSLVGRVGAMEVASSSLDTVPDQYAFVRVGAGDRDVIPMKRAGLCVDAPNDEREESDGFWSLLTFRLFRLPQNDIMGKTKGVLDSCLVSGGDVTDVQDAPRGYRRQHSWKQRPQVHLAVFTLVV